MIIEKSCQGFLLACARLVNVLINKHIINEIKKKIDQKTSLVEIYLRLFINDVLLDGGGVHTVVTLCMKA